MCPIVPMFTCGLLRSNFSLAIWSSAPQSKSCKIVLLKLLSAAGFLYNFFREIVGKLRVMREMHGECGASLRAAAQIRGVAEHLRERHLHANHVAPGAVFRSLNRRPPRVQIAEHLRHVLFWRHD